MRTFFGVWQFDLLVATNLIVAVLMYAIAVRRVNAAAPSSKRHVLYGRWPRWATTCFMTGLALIGLMYLGPMAAWSHTFFWVHMTQHLVITMAVAPLLVIGAPITLAFRASNAKNRQRIVRALRSKPVRVLTNPILTWLLFAGALVGAHFSPFYDWVLTNHGAMVAIEQPLFLVVAVLYYLPLIGANLLPDRPAHSTRLISLGLMMIPEATIGAAIYFSPVVLYDGFDTLRPFGLAALPDQQLSGALMWGLVMTIDAFWMMWVAADWFGSEERRARQEDARSINRAMDA